MAIRGQKESFIEKLSERVQYGRAGWKFFFRMIKFTFEVEIPGADLDMLKTGLREQAINCLWIEENNMIGSVQVHPLRSVDHHGERSEVGSDNSRRPPGRRD